MPLKLLRDGTEKLRASAFKALVEKSIVAFEGIHRLVNFVRIAYAGGFCRLIKQMERSAIARDPVNTCASADKLALQAPRQSAPLAAETRILSWEILWFSIHGR